MSIDNRINEVKINTNKMINLLIKNSKFFPENEKSVSKILRENSKFFLDELSVICKKYEINYIKFLIFLFNKNDIEIKKEVLISTISRIKNNE